MPIDSIAGLRHLSQAQGSFVRLDQSTDKLLSLIHITEPTRHLRNAYAVFCL